ncbi:hypothetical protein CHS0354_036948 [Potamilus streckersoni]|uniref:Uncharacterized protein n=1 Tax=Potamilus streckersoni TaxID=2493646 RepID=A0AAE0TBM4_9BIVA|nr:hypothetical protein CHS0354_036948 [Potamilus streckersoni]
MIYVAYKMSHSSLGRHKPQNSLSQHERKHTQSLKEKKACDGENVVEFGQHFLGVQQEEYITLYKHNLRAIDENSSDDGRRIKSATESSDSGLRMEIMKSHQFRRYSAPEIRVDLNHDEIPINSSSESLCGSNISSFYNLWNRPKIPHLLGRGSLPIPKELKLSGQFRDCGCPTRDERRKHECKGNLSTERQHHSM